MQERPPGTAPPGCVPWRCACGRLLMYLRLTPGSLVECKCAKCGALNRLVVDKDTANR